MIRLIACDLDGTLLHTDRTVSPRTVELINTVQQAGIRFVPASGRQLSNMTNVLEQLDFRGTVLSANGALAVDVPELTVHHQTLIDVAAIQQMVSMMKQRVPEFRVAVSRDLGQIIIGEHGYTENMNPLDGEPPTAGVAEATAEELLVEPTLKVIAQAPGWSISDLFDLAISCNVSGITAVDGGATFLEFQGENVSKGTGLARLCEGQGIDSSEVLAIGDWLNDLEMLEWAGVPVAVANAHPDIRARAVHITASNNDDGVAQVLTDVLNGRFAATN